MLDAMQECGQNGDVGIFRYELLFWRDVGSGLWRFCKEHYWMEILVMAIGLLTGVLWEGFSWWPVIYSLVSLFCLLGIIFVLNLVAAPSRIHEEIQDELIEANRLLRERSDSSPNVICTKVSVESSFVPISKLLKWSDLFRPEVKRESEFRLCLVAQAKFANDPTSASNRTTVKSVAAHIRYLDLDKKPIDTKFDQPVYGCWVDTDEQSVSVNLEANALPKTLALVSHMPGEKCVYPSDSKTRRNSWRDLSRTIDVPEFYISVTLKSESLLEDKSILFRARREDTGIEAFPTNLVIEIENQLVNS